MTTKNTSIEKIISDACSIARNQFIHLDYGEWSGSPTSVKEFNRAKLLEMQYLISIIIANMDNA